MNREVAILWMVPSPGTGKLVSDGRASRFQRKAGSAAGYWILLLVLGVGLDDAAWLPAAPSAG